MQIGNNLLLHCDWLCSEIAVFPGLVIRAFSWFLNNISTQLTHVFRIHFPILINIFQKNMQIRRFNMNWWTNGPRCLRRKNCHYISVILASESKMMLFKYDLAKAAFHVY